MLYILIGYVIYLNAFFRGRWFAIQEIKTIVSMVIRDYDLRAVDEVACPITRIGLPSGKVTIAKRQ